MKTYVTCATAFLGILPSSLAVAGVVVSIESPSTTNESPFVPGDTISAIISIKGDSPEAISAVDLELTCENDDVRIRSVTFDSAFSVVLGQVEGTLPGQRYRTTRGQPFATMSRTLGAGVSVPLATVELEVMNPEAEAGFTSGLQVKAHASVIGRSKPPTMIQILGQPPREESATLVIGTGEPESPSAPESPQPELPVWTNEQAAVTLEVQPAGGGQPLTSLAPNTVYELHYRGAGSPVAGYALFAVTSDVAQSITATSTASDGDWNTSGRQFIDLTEAPLPVPGDETETLRRRALIIHDLASPSDSAAGHLCNFTTGAAGQLGLHLVLWSFDVLEHRAAEMSAEQLFIVSE